jgi:integrase
VPDDIAEYAAERRKHVAPATVNRELAFLRRVFNAAIASRLVDSNPVLSRRKGGAFTKENNQRIRQLALEEEASLAREIPDPVDWAKVVVALHTGLRRGEQFRLRWSEHVDFTTGIVTFADSKSGEPRHVPMNDTVRAVLRALPCPLEEPVGVPERDGRDPTRRAKLRQPRLPASTPPREDRRLPLARPAPHVRLAARDGRG